MRRYFEEALLPVCELAMIKLRLACSGETG
jgi:hypothetical protein